MPDGSRRRRCGRARQPARDEHVCAPRTVGAAKPPLSLVTHHENQETTRARRRARACTRLREAEAVVDGVRSGELTCKDRGYWATTKTHASADSPGRSAQDAIRV